MTASAPVNLLTACMLAGRGTAKMTPRLIRLITHR